MGDVLGYARVPTGDQGVAGQELRLREAGAIQVFSDVRSGRSVERPGLGALLDYARCGDTLTIVRLDRLGRLLAELLATVAMLKERGVALLGLEEKIDTSLAAGEMAFHVFSAIAHFERRLVAECTRDGIGAGQGQASGSAGWSLQPPACRARRGAGRPGCRPQLLPEPKRRALGPGGDLRCRRARLVQRRPVLRRRVVGRQSCEPASRPQSVPGTVRDHKQSTLVKPYGQDTARGWPSFTIIQIRYETDMQDAGCKAVGILGNAGRVAQHAFLTTAEAFGKTGRNTGNLAFMYGFHHCLGEEAVTASFTFDPAWAAERLRVLCIPAANYLYRAFEFGDLATRIEKSKLPVLIAGLGAQAGRSVAEVKLTPGTERFLRVIAERSVRIAVRGRFTGEVLESYGVQNFEILGCPSNFINPALDLGAQIAARFAERSERVAFCPTFYEHNAHFEARVYREIAAEVEEIVCQEPLSALALARGERDDALQAWIAKTGFLQFLPAADKPGIVRKMRTYFGIEPWLDASLRTDLLLGTRIHGVSVAWQSGRAALLVPHDLRTQELVETMGLPHLAQNAVPRGAVLEAVRAAIPGFAQTYDTKRLALAARFLRLMEETGVRPSAHLASLAAGAKATTLERVSEPA
ncbi:recombinase family protein [Dankookia sp. GCM10030260]|uniref:recombinase family protein n=1 Tax=Dankookia sp. GCM10030260 TaxID=3273390 RepID=UPI003614E85C